MNNVPDDRASSSRPTLADVVLARRRIGALRPHAASLAVDRDGYTVFEQGLIDDGLRDEAERSRNERAARIRAAERSKQIQQESDRQLQREDDCGRRVRQLLHLDDAGAPPLLLDGPVHIYADTDEDAAAWVERVCAAIHPAYAARFRPEADDIDVQLGMTEVLAEIQRPTRPKAKEPKPKAGKGADLAERLLAFIEAQRAPVKRGDVYEAIGGSRNPVVEALDELVASGRVVETKVKNAKLVAIAVDDDDD